MNTKKKSGTKTLVPKIRALMPCDPSLKKNTVLDSISIVPELAKKIEPVGKAYGLLQGKFMRMEQRKANETDKDGKKIEVEDSEESEEEKSGDSPDNVGEDDDDTTTLRKKNKRARIEAEALEMGDLYGLLGVEVLATEGQIKTAFRKTSLKYHPDKLKRDPTEDDKAHWLLVQKAYDTLSDDGKRRKYDSSLPFDERIPKKDIDEKDFYEEYSKCFELNTKFAVNKPIPDLGDKDTPMDQVRKFYQYWDAFKSWREFAQYCEHDTEDANDRYEKRWMEKENKKVTKEYEVAERKRIFKMVNNAYNSDPRIQKELAEEEAALQAAKVARKAANASKYKVKEDNSKQIAEDAAAAKIKEDEQKKIDKEAKKLAGRKYRETQKDLSTFCEQNMPGTKFDKFFIEVLVKKYPKQEALDELVAQIKSIDSKSVEDFIDQFRKMVDAANYAKDLELMKEKEAKAAEEALKVKEVKSNEWTPEEIQNLTKGLTKFPVGTVNRWRAIADFVSSKTQKEVIAKSKDIQEAQIKFVEEKRQAEIELKEKHDRIKKEAQAKAKEELAAEKEAKKLEKKAAKEAAIASSAEDWTDGQQQQMEVKMREVPSSVATKERWIQIADGVDGKTPKDCFTRYKDLCKKAKETAAYKKK